MQKQLIPRASNKDVISFFIEIMPIIGAESFHINVFGSNTGLSYPSNSDDINDISLHSMFSISSSHITISSYNIRYQRGSELNEQNYAFDKIELGSNSHSSDRWSPSSEQVTKINVAIHKHFHVKKGIASAIYSDPKAFEQIITSHQLILSRLEDSLATVGERLTAERIKIEDEFRVEREKLNEQHRLKLEHIEISEKELESRRKSLDDRDNTHARRQIRADLKKRIDDHAKSFTLTSGTRTLRMPIHILTWISLGVLGVATYYFSVDINHMVAEAAARDKAIGPTEVIVLALKPLGLTVAFLGLLTWYLRWMNRWFERHAETEFQLKQFELDIDRASWVVETALEWRQEQQAPMPDHLIESISRNLFSRSEKDEGADMHPADYLASALLGRASGLKLKLPGADLEFEGKALKEAKQTADKAKA